MTTRLQRDINGSAPHIGTTRCRITQGLDFGMCLTGWLSVPGTDDFIIFNDDATNPWVGRSDEHPFGSPFQGEGHGLLIGIDIHRAMMAILQLLHLDHMDRVPDENYLGVTLRSRPTSAIAS